MNNFDLNELYTKLIVFLFILMRVSGALFFAPVFGSRNIPRRIKVWLSMFIAIALLPSLHPKIDINKLTAFSFFFYSIKEILIGSAIGFIINMPFLVTRVGAEIAGRMSGFGMGRVINPDIDENVSLLSQYIYLIVVLFFLTMNGHHIVIKALAKSFEYIPTAEEASFSGKITQITCLLFRKAFNAGISYGAPILGVLLTISLTMGILGKTVPQLNVMIFALPIQIAAGLITVMITFPILFVLLKNIIHFTEKCSDAIIYILSNGAH